MQKACKDTKNNLNEQIKFRKIYKKYNFLVKFESSTYKKLQKT